MNYGEQMNQAADVGAGRDMLDACARQVAATDGPGLMGNLVGGTLGVFSTLAEMARGDLRAYNGVAALDRTSDPCASLVPLGSETCRSGNVEVCAE